VLTEAELKPYLLHEDRLVRRAVVEYFKGSWSRDPELVPLILEAKRRYEPDDARGALAACERFVLTERSFDAMLGALAETEDGDECFLLNRALANAPVELLSRRESRLRATPGLLVETIEQVERRRDLASWPPDKLWTALEDLARSSQGRYVGDVDHGRADDLVEALGRHEQPGDRRLCELLRTEPDEHWLEIFVIDLVGARRVREAVPLLVAKFHIDTNTDYMLERASEALARIGDPRAVDLIRAAFPSADFGFKIYTSGVLANIKSEASEEALLALLGPEPDPDVRAHLCLGLCEQFSERGLVSVLREIDAGYSQQVACLETEVLPVAEILGVELPEAEAWRAAAEREEARIAKSFLEWELAEGLDLGDDFDLDDELDISFEPVTETTFRREGPKIGRNAPCPCGSGRKFKRCCGKPA
jgi:hypothetical protein